MNATRSAWNPGFTRALRRQGHPQPVHCMQHSARSTAAAVDCASRRGAHARRRLRRPRATTIDVLVQRDPGGSTTFAGRAGSGAIINLDDLTHGRFPRADRRCRFPRRSVLPIQPRRVPVRVRQRHHGQPRRRQVRHGPPTQLFEAFRILKAAKGAKHFGIHAFLCSEHRDQRLLSRRSRRCCSTWPYALLAGARARTSRYINLSGGVGIPTMRPTRSRKTTSAVIGEGVRTRAYDGGAGARRYGRRGHPTPSSAAS